MCKLTDLNIKQRNVLLSPYDIKDSLPLDLSVKKQIVQWRINIKSILKGKSSAFLIIIGPCSIHDPVAALEYAGRLKELHDKYRDCLCIVMRTYFEKPRTNGGWKGYVYDPYLDDSNKIEDGIKKSRELLLKITNIGLPTATEFLNPVFYQYIDDLISWVAIGARTSESQTHREMISAISAPAGFKNSTDGNFENAINAISFASKPQTFISTNPNGQVSAISTTGNGYLHLISRGGNQCPNYDEANIKKAIKAMTKFNVLPKIMVDCSHANSNKKPENQINVLKEILRQRIYTESGQNIIGVMLESFLESGKQSINSVPLKYGQSITDGCISWKETKKIIELIAEKLNNII